MKLKRMVATVAAGSLMAVAGGAVAWWGMRAQAGHTPEAAAAELAKRARAEIEKQPPKYVTLEKVIVMLRRQPDDATSHYLAVDLVFKTPQDQEKVTKEQLPMLRSVAVRALSRLTLTQASTMTVDEFIEAINHAYGERYAADRRDKPFSDVMIGKLSVE